MAKVKFVGLSHLTGDQKEIELYAKDVQSSIEELALHYGKFREEVIDQKTRWTSSNFLILLNDTVIHKSRNLNDGDAVSIVQAISGGL
ncbi:MAG: MoaD/ThiS family protein [Candidatus Bathyarchaeia archaeon]